MKIWNIKPVKIDNPEKRFNLEGYLLFGRIPNRKKNNSYVQFFRNGGVEIYTTYFHILNNSNKIESFSAERCEANTIKFIDDYFTYNYAVEIEPPFIIFLSLTDLKNASISDIPKMAPPLNRFDANCILFPGIIIENPDDIDKKAVEKLLHPTFNMLWQAAGWDRSPYYDDRGNRNITITKNTKYSSV